LHQTVQYQEAFPGDAAALSQCLSQLPLMAPQCLKINLLATAKAADHGTQFGLEPDAPLSFQLLYSSLQFLAHLCSFRLAYTNLFATRRQIVLLTSKSRAPISPLTEITGNRGRHHGLQISSAVSKYQAKELAQNGNSIPAIDKLVFYARNARRNKLPSRGKIFRR
jgi:hypothetical protein